MCLPKVLTALAKSWASLSAQRQKEVVDLLSPVAFVPTRQGPRVPGETYFSTVDLFCDLPIVTFPSGTVVKGTLDKVLTALGVRRHVEVRPLPFSSSSNESSLMLTSTVNQLQLVFTRLLGQGEWSIFEITRYLVGVRDTLSSVEIERLRQTQWLPKEGEARLNQPAGPDGVTPKPKVVRYSAKQLFEVSPLSPSGATRTVPRRYLISCHIEADGYLQSTGTSGPRLDFGPAEVACWKR